MTVNDAAAGGEDDEENADDKNDEHGGPDDARDDDRPTRFDRDTGTRERRPRASRRASRWKRPGPTCSTGGTERS